MIGFCMGVCNGFCHSVAQRMGAGDYSQMRRCVANAGWLSALFAVVLTVVTGLLCRTILTVMMQTRRTSLTGPTSTSSSSSWASPLTFLYNLLAAVIRALGDTRRPCIFWPSPRC